MLAHLCSRKAAESFNPFNKKWEVYLRIICLEECRRPAVKTFVSAVDKWTKQNKMDFLGIPSCVGFGLHSDSYRCENRVCILTHKLHMWEVYFHCKLWSVCALFLYRFLIFPNMGQSLQSIMEEENETLAEKTVLQLACRIVSVGFFWWLGHCMLASLHRNT